MYANVSATDAARRFADLLDGVEHRGEHYTIVRRGKAVAHLEPVATGRGADVKSLLRRHRPDAAWAEDLSNVRGLLKIDDRRLSLLLLDTTFLIDAERRGVDLDDAIDDNDDVAIAAVTVAELVGVRLASAKRQPPRQTYVDEIIESLPIIAYDRD